MKSTRIIAAATASFSIVFGAAFAVASGDGEAVALSEQKSTQVEVVGTATEVAPGSAPDVPVTSIALEAETHVLAQSTENPASASPESQLPTPAQPSAVPAPSSPAAPVVDVAPSPIATPAEVTTTIAEPATTTTTTVKKSASTPEPIRRPLPEDWDMTSPCHGLYPGACLATEENGRPVIYEPLPYAGWPAPPAK